MSTGTANEECYFCGEDQNLEEHHVTPRRYGGTDDESNLITVCGSCHKKIERTWDTEFYDQLGVRGGMSPNMMYDALKDIRFKLTQVRATVGGAVAIHEKQLEVAPEISVDDYGGTVTKRQVLEIKAEAYRELLDGEFWGMPGLDELKELEEFSYRAVEEFQDGDGA